MARKALLAPRLVALIAQAPGLTPKRMAVLLKVRLDSVWRMLRVLRKTSVLIYDDANETWTLVAIPGAGKRNFMENCPGPSCDTVTMTQHTGVVISNSDAQSTMKGPK